ncbi:hypothetical protein KEJ33_06245, partial [Candidatus Bathyarchaeota archaeon]|nr:hypothetical protein [Candidatus Bathyarchaeota archaeon]
ETYYEISAQANSRGLLILEGGHAQGSKQDYTIFDLRYPKLPNMEKLILDLGFDRIPKKLSYLNTLMPFNILRPGMGHRSEKGEEVQHNERRILGSGLGIKI